MSTTQLNDMFNNHGLNSFYTNNNPTSPTQNVPVQVAASTDSAQTTVPFSSAAPNNTIQNTTQNTAQQTPLAEQTVNSLGSANIAVQQQPSQPALTQGPTGSEIDTLRQMTNGIMLGMHQLGIEIAGDQTNAFSSSASTATDNNFSIATSQTRQSSQSSTGSVNLDDLKGLAAQIEGLMSQLGIDTTNFQIQSAPVENNFPEVRSQPVQAPSVNTVDNIQPTNTHTDTNATENISISAQGNAPISSPVNPQTDTQLNVSTQSNQSVGDLFANIPDLSYSTNNESSEPENTATPPAEVLPTQTPDVSTQVIESGIGERDIDDNTLNPTATLFNEQFVNNPQRINDGTLNPTATQFNEQFIDNPQRIDDGTLNPTATQFNDVFINNPREVDDNSIEQSTHDFIRNGTESIPASIPTDATPQNDDPNAPAPITNNDNGYLIPEPVTTITVNGVSQVLDNNALARREELRAFGLTDERLQQFDVALYFEQNPDLADPENGVDESEALHHYLVFGSTVQEARDFPSRESNFSVENAINTIDAFEGVQQELNAEAVTRLNDLGFTQENIQQFDAEQYLRANQDLIINGVELHETLQHYISYGLDEGREFPTAGYNFSVDNANQEIQVANGIVASINAQAQAKLNTFVSEARLSPETLQAFDAQQYLLDNPDLLVAGVNINEALQHYLMHGMEEGRQSTIPNTTVVA